MSFEAFELSFACEGGEEKTWWRLSEFEVDECVGV
jgi:hypothetical protein